MTSELANLLITGLVGSLSWFVVRAVRGMENSVAALVANDKLLEVRIGVLEVAVGQLQVSMRNLERVQERRAGLPREDVK